MNGLEPHLRTVERYAREHRLLRRVSRVMVALSGGADSLAALLLLREMSARDGFDIVAAHFDHKLRPESGADLALVREICSGLGVSCLTGEGDVRRMAEETGRGIEDAARTMRYQFLAFAAGKESADVIATGHTADDQVETILHHILRGTGIRGLRGMLPRSPVPGAEAQVLIRPVLRLRRAETEEVCRVAGIDPVVDASNRDLEYTRNRIRHQAVPALRKLNPSLDRALLGLAESAREAFAGTEQAAMATQPVGREPSGAEFETRALRDLPGEALGLVLEREAGGMQLRYDTNRTLIENLRQVLRAGTGRVTFGELVAEASMGLVRLGPRLSPPEVLEPVFINVPGATRAGDWRILAATEATAGAAPVGTNAGALRARTRRAGDRVRWAGGTRSLKRVFEDARIPSWRREGRLVIADGECVVAVPGLDGLKIDRPADDDETAVWVRAEPAS